MYYNIMRIRNHLLRKSTETLIHAFVSSRLDYCNSFLYGLPQVQIGKLQRVQNAAARLIFKEPKFSHITETWLSENDDAHKAEITPTGFKLIDHSRNNRRGGGTALLFRGNLNVQKIAAKELRSFKYLELIVSSGTFKVRLVILYRPPYSPSHPVTTSTFFADFADYLETLILSAEPLLITGDFNVHVDDSTNPDATRLLDLLDSMGLCQHVTHPTHELGHTIDLIITRQLDSIICGSPVTDHLFSDHISVLTTLRATKPKIILKERVYRKIKSIDLDSFCSDLAASEVCQDTLGELDELVDC